MTKTELEERLKEYVAAIASMDTDRWLSQFAEDATVEDPVGGPVLRGHEEMRNFYVNVARKTFRQMENRPEYVMVVPHEAVVKWTTAGVTHSGVELKFQGISAFKFREDGKVLQLRAFWDPKDVARQLKAAASAAGK